MASSTSSAAAMQSLLPPPLPASYAFHRQAPPISPMPASGWIDKDDVHLRVEDRRGEEYHRRTNKGTYAGYIALYRELSFEKWISRGEAIQREYDSEGADYEKWDLKKKYGKLIIEFRAVIAVVQNLINNMGLGIEGQQSYHIARLEQESVTLRHNLLVLQHENALLKTEVESIKKDSHQKKQLQQEIRGLIEEKERYRQGHLGKTDKPAFRGHRSSSSSKMKHSLRAPAPAKSTPTKTNKSEPATFTIPTGLLS